MCLLPGLLSLPGKDIRVGRVQGGEDKLKGNIPDKQMVANRNMAATWSGILCLLHSLMSLPYAPANNVPDQNVSPGGKEIMPPGGKIIMLL